MAYKTMLRQLISKWGIMSIELQEAYTKDMATIDENGDYEYIENDDTLYEQQEPIQVDTSVEEKEKAVPKKRTTKQEKEEVKEETPAVKETQEEIPEQNNMVDNTNDDFFDD